MCFGKAAQIDNSQPFLASQSGPRHAWLTFHPMLTASVWVGGPLWVWQSGSGRKLSEATAFHTYSGKGFEYLRNALGLLKAKLLSPHSSPVIWAIYLFMINITDKFLPSSLTSCCATASNFQGAWCKNVLLVIQPDGLQKLWGIFMLGGKTPKRSSWGTLKSVVVLNGL